MPRLLSFLIILILLIPLQTVYAFDFNPNNIISDFELKDKNSLSLSAIQSFLNDNNSVLKDLSFDVDGSQKTAAEIIYTAAQQHIISPKFILTKLDQEQCFIRGCSYLKDPVKLQKALDWACGFGVCTGCDLSDSRVQKYKGFAKQVDAVAAVQNDYIAKTYLSYIYAKGRTITTKDGYSITPETQATANLYTYTPYRGGPTGIGGNYLFARLWDSYWGDLQYPNGIALKDDDDNYWLIDGSSRRRYASAGVYLSFFRPDDAVSVADTILNQYSIGPEIKYANHSLARDENATVYLIEDDRKRAIADQETFRQLGFNPEEIVSATSADLASYRASVPITQSSVYPAGALLKTAGSTDLYWVQNGFKYALEPAVAELNYPLVPTQEVPATELAKYYPAGAQKIRDGKMVKSGSGTIYLVVSGILRPIPSVSDFINLFGENKWSVVKQVSDKVLALHTVGDPLQSSTYERSDGQVAGEQVIGPLVYKTMWIGQTIPNPILSGVPNTLKISFKNKSTDKWVAGEVYLKAEETGDQALNIDPVLVDMVHPFEIKVTPPASPAEQTLTFKLYTKSGQYISGGLYQTTVRVASPSYRAQIVSQNLPVAVKNTWSRVAVTVKIKNIGGTAWVRRKTGLKFLAGSGQSPFYDSADWFSPEIAAISLEPNKERIEPGETAVFRFTLKPTKIKPGTYDYRLQLYMTDQSQVIYWPDGEFMWKKVRVDG